ncbi:biotin--[acetyl-CoA-carboxylase] ligase [Tenacibaculum sp. 1_MG-2023]|uniref:biotin--[acetyl-CoA-carboxylase] ligase n=1 Tax=Tenacibaculum sp. 1_MG-2023 TaxID=3062653 RepID=UPI0026E122DD|nr:biotin--[acetyl-CoA-carboxylase] ligase [Tenacibaculum sp. 1_MG-2023]MDO6600172.1 biotin--[acetyl-CoA-carboxylase] ligase [Tenacibaculum sp. 1_MG-2023]
MKLIKLHTTTSTNSFLKELSKESRLDNFTVVVTDAQTSGRGQVQQKWQSESFKNLTFSVFVCFDSLEILHQKYLNFAISLAIFNTLEPLDLPKLTIKWPNDILSDNRKLCGVLIENQLKKGKINSSIIGIGLNVNQLIFNELPNATSLKIIKQTDFDLDQLLEKMIVNLKNQIRNLEQKNFVVLERDYLSSLCKFNRPSMFRDEINQHLFMGKIVGVSSEGKLQVELEDELVKDFGLKEIKFL